MSGAEAATRTLSLKTVEELAAALGGEALAPPRGGYTLTMREDPGTAETLETLARAPRRARALHLGWGSFRNLDIVAARRSEAALICDLNLHQLEVWEAVRLAIRDAATAVAFVEALPDLLPRTPRLRQFLPDTRAWLRTDLDRPWSWLCRAAPERYAHVRSRFAAGAVGFCALDLRGERGADRAPGFATLAAALRGPGAGWALDTVYVSNIPYMLRGDTGFFGERQADWTLRVREGGRQRSVSAHERMWRNLALVCGADTLLISAEFLAPDRPDDDPHWRTELGAFSAMRRQSLQREAPRAARWQPAP